MASPIKLKTPLKAYRIADIRNPIFSGEGASMHGGRWNRIGLPIIYASSTYAGALLEKLAQTGTGQIPKNQYSIEINIPKGLTKIDYDPQSLVDWETKGYDKTRHYGSLWLENKQSLLLIVPSTVVKKEWNILINPHHSTFKTISYSKPEPVSWDERLFH